MRVVHVCAYYAPAYVYGGPTRSVHALCRAQQAYGMDVEVFTTNAAGKQRLESAPQGKTFQGVRVRYFEVTAPARLLGAAGLSVALERELRGADIVHVHGLFNRTVWDAANVLHDARRPYVLSPRGMLETPALAHHRWRKQLSWSLKDAAVVRRAHVLHATSRVEANTLARHNAARVVHVHNPVECSDHPGDGDSWGDDAPVPAGAPVVLALGRIHRIKRLDIVAASFLEVHRRLPNARLVIAGPDEQQLRPSLEKLLEPATASVHWMGAVDGPIKDSLLRRSTVLVQCSDSESFGMSIAEALAAGKPVVATRTCPWEELQTQGCGFWVEQSPEAVADALHAVLTDPDLARRQGEAGRRFIRDEMSPARIAASWQSIYEAASGGKYAAA